MKIKLTMTLLTLFFSVFFVGCYGGGSQNSETEKDSEKGGDASDNKTLYLAETEEIPTLKTNGEIDGQSQTITSNIYEGLFRKDINDEPVEAVVEDYDVKNDDKMYTFYLKEDADWSNGDPVTAHDFVYAWKKALDPDTVSPHTDLMVYLKNAPNILDKDDDMYGDVDKLGVEAIDDKTLEVSLEEPITFLFDLLSHTVYFPQNEDFVEEQGEDYALESENLIFNGPFKMTEWNHDQNWVLEKNDKYWDKDNVKIDAVDTKVVKDPATEVNLFNSGEIDIASLSSDFIDEYEDSEDFSTESMFEAYFLRMNQQNEDLQNNNIRRALDMAYNKEEMADSILKDGSTPAYYIIAPDFPGFDSPNGEGFREKYGDLNKGNVDEAQEYFEKGLEELDKENISLELLSYDDEQRKSVAEYIKNEWENNLPNLEVNINQQPNKQKLDLESKQDYDISHSGWRGDIGDPVDHMDMFLSNGPYNWQDFKNEEFDKLVKKAQSDFSDPERRFEDLQKAEKILIEDEVAVSPMYIASAAILKDPSIKNYVIHGNNVKSYQWVEID